MLSKSPLLLVFIFLSGIGLSMSGCKTKAELRREQEFEKIKEDIKDVKGSKADLEVNSEETKNDIARLGTVIDEQNQWTRRQLEEIRKDLTSLAGRVQIIEQRAATFEQKAASEDNAVKQQTELRSRSTLENGKKSFDEGKYEDAAEILRNVIKAHPRSEEAKKAEFLLGDTYFASKDFASAALEFSEFKKSFPKDALIPNAIYKQAQSFRSMGKLKDARLFYQELIERFPKSPLSTRAKQEMRRLK
jgi:tol-pal system protein YbgF